MSEIIEIIDEETHVEFERYEQLSYEDKDDINVDLYVDNKKVGPIPVWGDSEMDGREYVCINYEIVYLDVIKNRD